MVLIITVILFALLLPNLFNKSIGCLLTLILAPIILIILCFLIPNAYLFVTKNKDEIIFFIIAAIGVFLVSTIYGYLTHKLCLFLWKKLKASYSMPKLMVCLFFGLWGFACWCFFEFAQNREVSIYSFIFLSYTIFCNILLYILKCRSNIDIVSFIDSTINKVFALKKKDPQDKP